MKGFLSETEVTIDAKGRFLLPISIKKKLPEVETNSFVLARGFEKNLVLYPAYVWQQTIQLKLDSLNDFTNEVRMFKKLFLNGATELEMDSAGRILLTKSLLEYAGISKEVILFAEGGKIEIWDKIAYQQIFENIDDNELSNLANKLLGGTTNTTV